MSATLNLSHTPIPEKEWVPYTDPCVILQAQLNEGQSGGGLEVPDMPVGGANLV